jgi:hypothetical protein
MTVNSVAAALSTMVAAYSTVPYVVAILNGKTKPHQLSWLVFFIMNTVVLLSQFLEGARQSVLITLMFVVGSGLIFLLSLQHGTRETSRWDWLLFSFAVATIAAWLLTRSSALAIWLTVAIDLAATAMTILKVRAQPQSEDPIPWIWGTIAYAFTCLTLIRVPLGILYVRPVYGLAGDAILVGTIFFWRRRSRAANVDTITPAGV